MRWCPWIFWSNHHQSKNKAIDVCWSLLAPHPFVESRLPLHSQFEQRESMNTASNGSPSSGHDLVGKQLGEYHLLRRLGHGGMADVYLAEQQSLKRQVAFKVLKPDLAEDDSCVRRFHKEAQAAAALVHAHIIQIYEVGACEGMHFIAQEYVGAGNLRQWLSKFGVVDAKTAVVLIRQVAAALDKAAEHGVVHRDIKPENIMLARSGEVKVADFGIARVLSDGETAQLTQTGFTLGSPLYMSPEQIEGKAIDPRSDLYSLGATSYHLLSGRPPFEAETQLALAMQHLRKEPERLEDIRHDLPHGLCRIVHKLLAKQVDQRFSSAGELLTELRGLQIEGLDEADWPTATQTWHGEEPSPLAATATQQLKAVMQTEALLVPRRRSGWLIGLLLAAAFVVGGLLAWLNKPVFLLSYDSRELPQLIPQETVQMQYFVANVSNDERSWKAVAEHFPPGESHENRLYAYRAQAGLATFYRENGQLEAALSEYAQLANAPRTEVEFQATGVIGQLNIYSQQGNGERLTELLDQLAHLLADIDKLDRVSRNQLIQQLDLPLRKRVLLTLKETRSPTRPTNQPSSRFPSRR